MHKQKCEERDKFLIHKVKNGALNGDPSFVFKSSKSMAQLALAMDKDESGILKEEYVFFIQNTTDAEVLRPSHSGLSTQL